ncbi:hypothetical protein [Mesorhizobium sp. M0276]|uniref:hypothetical protein n=1 Tax=Mesorhizobium sp. M0276 TaxID=2956928 RepID=UPI003337F831
MRSDGSDANAGLVDSAGGAFLTFQHAIDVVAKTLDLRGFNVTIQGGPGTHVGDGRLFAPLVGNGTLTILGNTAAADYDDVTITGGFYATNGAQFFVRGVKISSGGAGSWSLYASGAGSCITWSYLNFGAVTGGGDHMIATDGGVLINDIGGATPYKITGGALNHYHATEDGHIRIAPQTVQITGTPNFTGQFAGVASGDLMVVGVNYAGAVTGRAYLVHLNGVICAEAANARLVLPGDVAGIEKNGGRIDAAPMFAANKNSVDQVIANGGWVKVTMGTLTQQEGADYSTSNSSWNPRSGMVVISATVTFSAINALNEICGISIFKNGAEYKSRIFNSSHLTNPQSATVTIEDLTDGDDVYEVYARGGNTGSSAVSGSAAWTYWSGRLTPSRLFL